MAEIWRNSLAGLVMLKTPRVWQKSADGQQSCGKFQLNLSVEITLGALKIKAKSAGDGNRTRGAKAAV